MQHTITDVVNRLKRNKETGKGCVLLIGAGCSATAGIPLAGEFVRIISDEFAHEYQRANDRKRADYPGCMGELSPGDRRELMGRYLSKARINWAHIHIARLIKEGYVDRVLTTNFDPLLVRACALFNIFPAVYDMAAIKGFEPQRIDGPAIFHLHGTGSGFFQAHDDTEVNELSEKLAPLFVDCLARPRTWIVAGYSAKCDPVVEHLLRVPVFDQNLYWIGYRDEEPSTDIEPLLSSRRAAYWLSGHHADGFFASLADGVKCAPPPFLDKPFTHLESVLSDINGFREEDRRNADEQLPSFASDALRRIRRAIKCIEPHSEWSCSHETRPVSTPATEKPESLSLAAQLKMRLMAEDWEAILDKKGTILDSGDKEAIEALAWAYNGLGLAALTRASKESGSNKQSELHNACKYYEECLTISPNFYVAHNNMGSALMKLWLLTNDDSLLETATGHYRAAIAISPESYNTRTNLAGALLNLSRSRPTNERINLLSEALIECNHAIAQNSAHANAFVNRIAIATDLAILSNDKSEKERLLDQAIDDGHRAVTLAPNDPMSHNALASSILHSIRRFDASEFESRLLEAKDHARTAIELDPRTGHYNLACIFALMGDEQSCRASLDRVAELPSPPSKAHVLADPDLASVRDKPWFKEFAGKLRG